MRFIIIPLISLVVSPSAGAGDDHTLNSFERTATAALQSANHADLEALYHTAGASPYQLDLSWESIVTNFRNHRDDSPDNSFEIHTLDDPTLNPKAVASLNEPKIMNGHRYAPNLPVEFIGTFPGGSTVAIGRNPNGAYGIAMKVPSPPSPVRPPDPPTPSVPNAASQAARLARFKLDLWSALSDSSLLGLDSLLYTRDAPPDAVDSFVSLLESMLLNERLDTIKVQPIGSLVPEPSEPPQAVDSTILNGRRYQRNLRSSGICSVRAVSSDGGSSGGMTFRIGIDPQGNYRIPFFVHQPIGSTRE